MELKGSLQSSQRDWNWWGQLRDLLMNFRKFRKISSHYRSENKYLNMLNNLTKIINLLSVRACIRTQVYRLQDQSSFQFPTFFDLSVTYWGYSLNKNMWQGDGRKFLEERWAPCNWWWPFIDMLVADVLASMINHPWQLSINKLMYFSVLENVGVLESICSYSNCSGKCSHLEQMAFWMNSI